MSSNNNRRSSFKFTKRIEIVELQPPSGPEPGETEVLFSKAWADIKTMKGYQYDTAVMAKTVGKVRFIIRYMKGIKPTMKIVYKGNKYKIESIENDDHQNRTITIIAETESGNVEV